MKNFSMNSSTDFVMFTAWSVTLVRLSPSGRAPATFAVSASSALPRSRPFQPSCITTASINAGSP